MTTQRPKKLLEPLSDAIRRKHYSYRTEQSYVHWIKHFILFHDKCHPRKTRCGWRLGAISG